MNDCLRARSQRARILRNSAPMETETTERSRENEQQFRRRCKNGRSMGPRADGGSYHKVRNHALA